MIYEEAPFIDYGNNCVYYTNFLSYVPDLEQVIYIENPGDFYSPVNTDARFYAIGIDLTRKIVETFEHNEKFSGSILDKTGGRNCLTELTLIFKNDFIQFVLILHMGNFNGVPYKCDDITLSFLSKDFSKSIFSGRITSGRGFVGDTEAYHADVCCLIDYHYLIIHTYQKQILWCDLLKNSSEACYDWNVLGENLGFINGDCNFWCCNDAVFTKDTPTKMVSYQVVLKDGLLII
ncbi:MAG TPA: hypothetical protein DCO86_04920 [Spirochaetaceae bacterium]|nr:hypothetical protein [Spirochaetaceae bacterium]